MRHIPVWFFPSATGDFRLEAVGEEEGQCKLTVRVTSGGVLGAPEHVVLSRVRD